MSRNLVTQGSVAAGAAAVNAGLEPFVSLGLALLGVALARVAFTTRQQRLGERISILEEVVIAGMAMLVVGPVVWEHQLGITTSALLGLGAGWSAILLFDAIGSRVIQIITSILPNVTLPPTPTPSIEPRPDPRPAEPPIPGDMVDLLEDIDTAEARAAAAAAAGGSST